MSTKVDSIFIQRLQNVRDMRAESDCPVIRMVEQLGMNRLKSALHASRSWVLLLFVSLGLAKVIPSLALHLGN